MTSLDVPLVSSLLHCLLHCYIVIFYTFSKYFIVDFEDVFLAAFTSGDQRTDMYELQNMQAQVQIKSY